MGSLKLLLVLGCFQVSFGGYVPASYYPSGSYYPTLVQQPYPLIQVQQKQPLQLRPPANVVQAVPNTRPPVTVVHAEQQLQQRPIQTVSQASAVQALPVVAIQAQGAPRKIVLPEPAGPSYSFGYAVKDAITGDEKSHEETRSGDNVIGKYTVVEPDGALRTVTYTAGINGFNAIVERTPGYAPPNAPAKVVAVSRPVAVAKPVAIASPVAVSKPIAIAASSPFGIARPVQAIPTYPAGFHFGG